MRLESMTRSTRHYSQQPLEAPLYEGFLCPTHNNAKRSAQSKNRLPTFQFLGFTCYWGGSRRGYWTLRFTSRRDRFTSKLKGLRLFLRKHLNTKDTPALIKTAVRVVKGWVNYHNISYKSE